MIRATFGTIDKLKENKGMLIYEGDSEQEAGKAEREFVKNMGFTFGIDMGNGKYCVRRIGNCDNEGNCSFIDFGSHNLFIMEKVDNTKLG